MASHKPKPQEKEEEKHPPGYYPCRITGHPGHIQYPSPMTYPHFKVWWELSIESVKELVVGDFKYWDAQWEAAKQLILKYGKWEIESISRGDVEDNNLPLEVISFVRMTSEIYIYPKLSPAQRRLVSSVF